MFPVPQHLGVLLHRITIAPHQCHKPRDGGQLGRHDISHGENDFGSQLNRTFGQSRAGTVAPLELVEQYKYCGIVYIYIYILAMNKHNFMVWGDKGMLGMIIG